MYSNGRFTSTNREVTEGIIMRYDLYFSFNNEQYNGVNVNMETLNMH